MIGKKDLKFYAKFIVIGLLAIMLILEISSALKESQTIDEATHLAAGYSYWRTGDFRMNPEHPALVKLISAFPLLFLKLNLPLDRPWQEHNEWSFASQFLYHNTEPADKILFLGRLPTMLISLLMGYFIYKWARELFGLKAGIFALFLYVLEPNIIAHSRYVTTDIQITFFFLLSIYYFGKYLKKPGWRELVVAGCFFAVAQVIKFSAVILIPTMIVLFLIKRWLDSRPGQNNVLNYKKFLFGTLIFLIITGSVILLTYGFEVKIPYQDPRIPELYRQREEIIRLGNYKEQIPFVRPLIKIADPQTGLGKFIFEASQKIRVPAYSYFRGFFSVLAHNYTGHGSYLLGQQGDMGWWYYFIIAFLVKTPLAILIFLGFSIFILLKKFLVLAKKKLQESKIKNRFKGFFSTLKVVPFDYYLITIPPSLYFLWSLTSHINLGVRHIFPIFPFVYLISSSIINYEPLKLRTAFKIFFILICMFYIFSSFSIYPNYLTYFNEAAGGPKNGHKILLDSNLDWGQDVKKLKKYLDENNISQVRLAYFGTADLNYYGINFLGIPKNEEVKKFGIPCDVIALNLGALYSKEKYFTWLLDYKPKVILGNTFYIYDFR